MSKEIELTGKFEIVLGSKGGIGKSTIAQNVIAPLVFSKTNEKVLVLEVDDNNVSDSLDSDIINFESFKVGEGVDKTMRELFEVYNGKRVVVDVGGGNDTTEFFKSIRGLELDDKCTFYIPLLKNKSGMKNLLDTISMIREYSKSEIRIILNQAKSTNEKDLQKEFTYFYGDESLNIKSVFDMIDENDNIKISSIQETQVFDLAEDYGLTAYEIATDNINISEYRDNEAKKGSKELMKALVFINIFNMCKEYKKNTLDKFFKDCEDV